LYFHVSNLIVKSKELKKSGLEVEIGRYFTEIYLFSFAKPAKSQIFEEIEKI
jgi:hypothetical protein